MSESRANGLTADYTDGRGSVSDQRNLRNPRSICVLLLAFCTVACAEDWPQWRGPNGDGVWHETNLVEAFPKDLKVAWRATVGRGYSTPIIVRGRVYLTDVVVANSNATERVLCFDEAKGKVLWTHKYAAAYPDWALSPNGGGPRATPLVRDGKLWTLGAMGHLFCLDAANGHAVWTKNLTNEYQTKEFTGITGSPLIEENLLILNICGKPAACVVAWDKDSGKEAWRALDDSFTYSSPIVITAGRQRQLIVWSQEAVTSLNPKTGQTLWREPLRTSGDMAVSTPVCDKSRLLIAGLMFKLDANKPAASVVWPVSRALGERVLSNTSTPLLLGDYVYSAKISGELVCLDAATGKQLWTTNTVTSKGNGSAIHLTQNGNTVLLFTDQGNVIRARLTPQGYREISRAHVIDAIYAFNGRNVTWPPPAYANAHIFARNDQELVCTSLRAETTK